MATGQSTWFYDRNGNMARLDVSTDGSERWTAATSVDDVFPALKCYGVTRFRATSSFTTPGTITGARPTGVDEITFDVVANGWNGATNFDWPRPVRVDMTSGAVVEYPAPFAPGIPQPNQAAIFTSGSRQYRMFDGTAWQIFNTVTQQFIAQHAWNDAVFTLSTGGHVGLQATGKTIGVDNGKLYLRTTDTPSSYRVFDLDNLTTDGILYGAGPGSVPPTGLELGWSVIADPESWRRRRPAAEFSRDLLEAINVAAHDAGTVAQILLTVMTAESGLRTTAYHPAGRYGLMQLTAAQLAAAGWTGTPEDYLAAGEGQMPAIRTYLQGLGIPPDADELFVWICHLLAGEGIAGLLAAGLDLPTVLAAPNGPRPELWASHGIADMDGDGQLTVGDLNKYLRRLRNTARFVELKQRLSRFAAVIPDWPDLAEVNQGDEMGIVRPSAAQLGLLVNIVALQRQPGFDDQKVVSINPPAGTLQRLVDPVQVQVNFDG
jgi:hypothetical protein